MNTRTRTTILAAVVAATVAGGGVAWSAIDRSMPGGSTGQSMMAGGMSMMGGADGMAMGQFSADKPFDLQFIDQMTVHHQGALMSTRAMIADSERPELRNLAAAIEASQTAQITQMQTWRTQWYGDAPDTFGESTSGMSDMMGGMGDMMGGAHSERMYLQMMIAHHQMGVDMATEAVIRSTRPEIRQLAQQIADEQSTQITLMEDLLSGN